jgi:RNA polymerase sigma-70 factor (ECF subfamily)
MPLPSRAPLALVVAPTRRGVSDAQLAQALAAGEDWAIAEAWRRFAPLVLTTAERALGSKSDAEDLAQEVFLRLFRKVKTLRDPASLRSFVYSVTVRALKSELRYRRLKAWLTFRGPESLPESSHTSPDLEARDLLQRLYSTLDRLSARDRLVFTLRRAESMTVEEIAATMGISVSTVKRSLTHASARLTRWVAGDPALSELLDGGLERKRD